VPEAGFSPEGVLYCIVLIEDSQNLTG
jgi:hypothetical protein